MTPSRSMKIAGRLTAFVYFRKEYSQQVLFLLQVSF
jgi:hypothetical protein